MTITSSRFTLTLGALAAALAVVACKDPDERIPNPQADATPSAQTESTRVGGSTAGTAPSTATDAGSYGAAGTSPSGMTGSTVSGSGTADAAPPHAAPGTKAPGAVGAAATAPLAAADTEFVTKAAEGGHFEVEIAKLAVEKSKDPQVKSFAQMLVDDHGAANEKLRQIASAHKLALPAALPEDKKRQIELMNKLSGAEFDRQFLKIAGLSDHRHDIEEFEKAARSARSDDVKRFAQATLPTLKKHLSAAEQLTGARKG